MAGYSGTPLVKKLGLKIGQTAVLLQEPSGFRELLLDLPQDFVFKKKLTGAFDYIHFFCKKESDLAMNFPKFPDHLADKGMVWISWPKMSSGVQTDLKEDKIREIGLKTGLVDVKVCAIDSVWSGLLFRRRKS